MTSPKYHILKKYANGVMDQAGKFYPYRIAIATIAAKNNTRYYLDKITISSSQSGAVATSVDKVEATVAGTTQVVAQNNIPATFVASNEEMTSTTDAGILTDPQTAVTVTIASVAGLALVKYCEIPTATGEYLV